MKCAPTSWEGTFWCCLFLLLPVPQARCSISNLAFRPFPPLAGLWVGVGLFRSSSRGGGLDTTIVVPASGEVKHGDGADEKRENEEDGQRRSVDVIWADGLRVVVRRTAGGVNDGCQGGQWGGKRVWSGCV